MTEKDQRTRRIGIGTCGRSITVKCGLKDAAECKVHGKVRLVFEREWDAADTTRTMR